MAIHTGAQLYSCPHCSKECRSQSNMYVHIKRNHTDEWIKAKIARSHDPTFAAQQQELLQQEPSIALPTSRNLIA